MSDPSPVTVTVNGASVAVSNGSFSAQVSLSEGVNEIRVLATDSSGNQSEASRNVTRDTAIPVLAISAPSPGSVARLVSISGTVTDATPVTVTANGSALAVLGETFRAQCPARDWARFQGAVVEMRNRPTRVQELQIT